MELNAGRYQVEVSAVGYEKKVVWASLRAGEDKHLYISPQPVEVSRLEARNTASPTADGRWDWTVYIDADPVSLQRIKCVEYTLHKTFPNPVRTCCNPRDKFALSSNGWGTFQIKIKVMFEDGIGCPPAIPRSLSFTYLNLIFFQKIDRMIGKFCTSKSLIVKILLSVYNCYLLTGRIGNH